MTPIELHRRLLYLRRAEELLSRLYKEQEMRTPTHFSIGQEAVAVGVCAALNLPHDQVFTHHRSHAAYLACGASFEALAAELYGRETGCSRGRGGSVHLTSRDVGFVMSSAILGQSIAVAVGAALAMKLRGEPHAAVCFFGDGAMEEGIVYESFNYAALKQLPILFVCENNGWSTEAPFEERFPAGTELCDRAVMFRVGAMQADGLDVRAVYQTAQKAVEHVRKGQPVFLECKTDRWLEHVGPFYDHEQGRTHRTESDLRRWQERDCVRLSDERLREWEVPGETLDRMDEEIQAALLASAERAKAAPMPDKSTLFENVY